MSRSDTPAPGNPPRDPACYRPSQHFCERFKGVYDDEPGARHLDGEIVNQCITEGVITRADRGRVYYRATVAGVTYRLVANPGKGVVITGYPLSINTEAARRSGRWSADQVEDIREFLASSPRS